MKASNRKPHNISLINKIQSMLVRQCTTWYSIKTHQLACPTAECV